MMVFSEKKPSFRPVLKVFGRVWGTFLQKGSPDLSAALV
jgi:hypothetical protein